MDNLQIFNYNNSPVSFQLGEGNVLINASEMAKPFRKRPTNWLATKQAQELITTLSAVTDIPVTGLVIVNQGGSNQGTWLHEDLALLFAQWLSPEFYLWCNGRVKELLRFGLMATEKALRMHVQLFKEYDERIKELKGRLDKRTQEPLAIGTKERLYTTTEIAEMMKTTAQKLNRLLKDMGIQVYENNQWCLNERYYGFRYTRSVASYYKNKYNERVRCDGTKWTERGKDFILYMVSGIDLGSQQ